MARKRQFKRKPKRVTRKQRSNRKRIATGFPKQMVNRLVYHDLIELTPSAGGSSTYSFRANDAFDPDYSGGGHQPRTHDEHMAIYRQWYVLGSKITFNVLGDGNNTYVWQLVANVSTEPSTGYGPLDLVEQPNATKIYLVRSSTGEAKTLTRYYSPKQWLKGKTLSNDNFLGTSTASPNSQFFYNLVVGNTNANAVGTLYVNVTIEYTILYQDRVMFGSS